MNFKNIKYFIAIAEEKNISSAARKLYISQQSLSEQLKKLEEEVGTPLIKRQNPLVLTMAGEVMYENGKKILQDYDTLLSDIQGITAKRRSHITIGIATYAQPPFLPELIQRYEARYPQFDVSVIKRQHTDISHNMHGVDLYISYLPIDNSLKAVPILADDPYCVMFRKSLAEKAYGASMQEHIQKLIDTQDLSSVSKLPFILLEDRHGQLSEDLAAVFHESGFSPSAGFRSESGDLNLQMCLAGSGALLAPSDYLKRSVQNFRRNDQKEDDPLLQYPLKISSFRSQLAICYEKDKHLHPAELCFIKTFQEMFSAPPV